MVRIIPHRLLSRSSSTSSVSPASSSPSSPLANAHGNGSTSYFFAFRSGSPMRSKQDASSPSRDAGNGLALKVVILRVRIFPRFVPTVLRPPACTASQELLLCPRSATTVWNCPLPIAPCPRPVVLVLCLPSFCSDFVPLAFGGWTRACARSCPHFLYVTHSQRYDLLTSITGQELGCQRPRRHFRPCEYLLPLS